MIPFRCPSRNMMHCPVLRSHTLPNESKPSKRIELIWKVVEQVHLQSRQVLHHLERQQCTPPCCDLLDARPVQSFIETVQKRNWKWLYLSQLFQVPKTPRVVPYCCCQKPVKGWLESGILVSGLISRPKNIKFCMFAL